MKNFILNNKSKIIIGAVIVCILCIAFFSGGSKDSQKSHLIPASSPSASVPPSLTASPTAVAEKETPAPSIQPSPTLTSDIRTSESLTESDGAYGHVYESESTNNYFQTETPNSEISFVNSDENVCTLTIKCDEILKNMDRLNPDKAELIPHDGIIFAGQKIDFDEGDSVFDVLLKETRKNKIHMEFVNSASAGSVYIEGINNLYEFDCGPLSGWIYSVNGQYPNVGCSQYKLKAGDKIEFSYTCG